MYGRMIAISKIRKAIAKKYKCYTTFKEYQIILKGRGR